MMEWMWITLIIVAIIGIIIRAVISGSDQKTIKNLQKRLDDNDNKTYDSNGRPIN